MGKYISLGQFNKYYFLIISSISIRFLATFISGFYPFLSPDKPIFLLGFKSNFFLPNLLIYFCFQYFGIFIGVIFHLIFKIKNKKLFKEGWEN